MSSIQPPVQEKGSHHQQPQPTAPMFAGPGGNRNAKGLPVGPSGRSWSFGLFDCFSACGTCLFAHFCACFVYGRIKRRYDHLATQGTPDPDHGGCFSTDCCLFCVLAHFGVWWILECMFRTSVRERYNIDGGCPGDCFSSLCCHSCQLTQADRELELEEGSLGG